MKDTRLSIRLSEEEHVKFKLIAVKSKKKMQDILYDYVKEIIKAEEENAKKD